MIGLLSLAMAVGPALSVQGPLPASASADHPVIVHLADGTSIPLRGWTLSYEYLTWPAGASQVMASAARRDTRELWSGRKSLDVAGRTMELDHEMQPREPMEGWTGPPEVPLVRRLRLLGPGGRKEDLRPEPPPRERLAPGSGRGVVVLARSLDLRGETLTGTRRELCVLSYTSLVECGVEKAGRVVRIDFPNAPRSVPRVPSSGHPAGVNPAGWGSGNAPLRAPDVPAKE